MSALDEWCPSCGARPGALCVTGSGNVLPETRPHRARTRRREDEPRRMRRRSSTAISAAARLAVIRRSGGWCEACPIIDPNAPRHPGEDAHHRLRRSQGGTNDPSNLVWACRRGHALIHDHPARAFDLGLLERRTTT